MSDTKAMLPPFPTEPMGGYTQHHLLQYAQTVLKDFLAAKLYSPNPIDIERLGMVSYDQLSEAEVIMVLKRRGEVMTGQKMSVTSYGYYFFWKAGRSFEHPDYIEAETIGEAVNLYLTYFEYANPSASNSLFALPIPRKTT